MNTKNLNKHLFEQFGLNLTKECLEEISKIVIEENNNNCTITTGFELTHHRRSHKIRNSEIKPHHCEPYIFITDQCKPSN